MPCHLLQRRTYAPSISTCSQFMVVGLQSDQYTNSLPAFFYPARFFPEIPHFLTTSNLINNNSSLASHILDRSLHLPSLTMRLLHSITRQMKEFISENATPPYAILSHTWGELQDECTLKDWESLSSSEIQKKPGFQKIEYCCQQAAKEGLE